MTIIPIICGFVLDKKKCQNHSTLILSIRSNNNADEYMVGTVCLNHADLMELHIKFLQNKGVLPLGTIQKQEIKIVSTNCIKGNEDDILEIKMKRGLVDDSDRF